jgi:hypothetical protein
MYYLDVGMLSHYFGNFEKSNDYLSKAEDAIEELYTASITKAAASLLLNDNALDYAGEDYEDIYLNVFKSLNYIQLNKWDDAMVEIKRINNKLTLLEDKYKKLAEEYNKDKDAKIKLRTGTNNFYNSALGRYISMLLYRGENDWDNARIDRDKILEAFAAEANLYPFAPPNLDSAVRPGAKSKVNFVCFLGQNPDKIANTLRIRSQRNMLVLVPSKENEEFQDEIKDFAAIPWPGIAADYYFKFQIPTMKFFGTHVAKVRISLAGPDKIQIDGGQIENMEQIAKATFDVKKPLIYLKTILRTVAKGIIAGEAKKGVEKADKGGFLSCLFSAGADLLVDVSENADLRTSHYLPAYAFVAEADVAPGKYQVVFDYFAKNGSLLFSDKKGEVEVKSSGLTLCESFLLE